MATSSQRILRVGATVVVALTLAMLGTFLIGREQRFWESKQAYEIRFTRINGLRVGAPVSLTGVDIGSVQAVSFPSDPGATYIIVSVSISGRAAQRIREDSIARIRTIGLLGDKYVEIGGGDPQSPVLPPGSVIPSADPIDYEALLGESGDIVTNIVETTNSLRNVLASIERGEGLLGQIVKNREQGATTLTDLQRTVAHVEGTTASFERIVKELEAGKGALGVLLKRGEQAQHVLANLERASGDLATLTAKLNAAQGALPQLVLDHAYGDALLRDLRRTAENLAEVSEKLNHGDGTAAQLVNDPSLYRDAKGLVSSTRESWMFLFYRGFRGLFPPYAPATADPVPPPAEPAPTPTVTP
jgi:phospholipid/cholesterol/gamma-HCH transport system substrate-binding protein